MRRLFLLLCLGLTIPALSFGQPLQGTIYGEVGPGIVQVSDTCYVPADSILTILPGTTLSFTGPFSIEVQGSVMAVGNEAEPVQFCNDETSSFDWTGFRFINSDSSSFVHCSFVDAMAGEQSPESYGGAIYMNRAIINFEYCTFTGNYASKGGALYVYNSTAYLTCSLLEENSAQVEGGALYISGSDFTIFRCIFNSNSAVTRGGVFSILNSPESMYNCTFINNEAAIGAAIYHISNTVQLYNSIFAGNIGQSTIINDMNANFIAQYNCFYENDENFEGDNLHPALGMILRVNQNGDSCDFFYNLYRDPVLSPWRGDHGEVYILENSPCIDAGDPASEVYDPDGSIPDMGAYPYSADDVTDPPQSSAIPGTFAFEDVYPNPFNGDVTIGYSLPSTSAVKADVYALDGRLVTSLSVPMRQAGNGQVHWRPDVSLSSGVYLVKLTATDLNMTGLTKVVYVK